MCGWIEAVTMETGPIEFTPFPHRASIPRMISFNVLHFWQLVSSLKFVKLFMLCYNFYKELKFLALL